MAEQKNYQEYQLGFDRTQLFKEQVQPQINRSAALKATIEFCSVNDLQLDIKETIALTKRFVQYIETGNTSWMDVVEQKLQEKKQKQLLKEIL